MDMPASSRRKDPAGVSFGKVNVAAHSIRLGDNPSVSQGLPVRLGEKIGSETFDVEDYESKRGPRRPKTANKLSKEERDALVMKKHSRSSLVRTRKEVKEIKISRINNRKSEKVATTKFPMKGILWGWFKRKKNSA